MLLFTGSAVAGALAAVGGLIVGLKFAGRIQGIVEKADALSHLDGTTTQPPVTTVRDELGALDAAVGRLTLSMDRFIRDSDILARLPEGMLLVDPAGVLVSFNATAETLLDLPSNAFAAKPSSPTRAPSRSRAAMRRSPGSSRTRRRLSSRCTITRWRW